MNQTASEHGFTVVELLVALAVAAVLFGYALPSFNEFTYQRTLTTRVNNLVLAVNYARSEATRRGATVSVQATDASDADNEWGEGFCVVVGNPGNCNDPAAVLATFPEIENATIDGNVTSMSFNARGLYTGATQVAVQICGADADDDPGRSLTMTMIGRVSANEAECFPADGT